MPVTSQQFNTSQNRPDIAWVVWEPEWPNQPPPRRTEPYGSSPVGASASQQLQDTFAVDLYPAPLIKWHPSVEQHESLVMDAEKRGLINKQPP